jgi:hypothetical protein
LAEVSIPLSSVETFIDIRNERMRDILFKVADFPTVTVTAEIPMDDLAAPSDGERTTSEVDLTLAANGAEAPPLRRGRHHSDRARPGRRLDRSPDDRRHPRPRLRGRGGAAARDRGARLHLPGRLGHVRPRRHPPRARPSGGSRPSPRGWCCGAAALRRRPPGSVGRGRRPCRSAARGPRRRPR